jgi:hypothetical protein
VDSPNNYDNEIKGQLVRSYQFFMSTQIITISEDVMNTVIKPISLFLNDIEKNTIFTHNPANAKGVSIMTSLIKATCLLLHIIERCTYKFTAYDLRNFSHKGVPFKDQVENGKVIHVAETFTITKKSTALLVDDEKVYPPFCYKNYAEYAVESRSTNRDLPYR